MNRYPIVANCNFESRDDEIGKAIHAARKAVEAGLTDDAQLLAALEDLEDTLAEHADHGDVESVSACRSAERAVKAAWASDVQAEVDATRQARWID